MRNTHRAGFTLIELIIVLAIIAIIAAFVFVSIDPISRTVQARNASRWQGTKSLVDAGVLYRFDNGDFPVAVDATLRMIGTAADGCDTTCGNKTFDETTISIRIATGNDDAEERNPPGGTISRSSTDLELNSDGGTDQEVGMRFQNVTVPAGAIVSNAYVEFTTDETNAGATSVTFYGEDTDDADGFSADAGDITNRQKTAASVDWNNIPAWNIVDETHQTPDLSTIIQEIIDRDGWSSGNDMVIISDGTGERTAESFNGSAAEAPLLVITYQATGENTPAACIDLTNAFESYLPQLPFDPKDGSLERTQYAVQTVGTGSIRAVSCAAENNEAIENER